MKRVILFTSIFLMLSMGLIAFFGVKPKAYMETDDGYIYVNHNLDTSTIYAEWPDDDDKFFDINFYDTTELDDLPKTFQTLYQYGSFTIYFNSDILSQDFFNDYYYLELHISNGSTQYSYEPIYTQLYYDGFTYIFTADFKTELLQEIDISTNVWHFQLKMYGDWSTDKYIQVLDLYQDNQSNFKWYYFRDFNDILTEYEMGYRDGKQDGEDIGYQKGYDNGYDDGIVDTYHDGFEGFAQFPQFKDKDSYSYHIGFNAGIEASNDYSFAGLLGQVFIGLGSLLAINLLPGISLGAIIAVPVVFGIIAFILGKRGGKDD